MTTEMTATPSELICVGRVCFAERCEGHGVHVVVQGDNGHDYLMYRPHVTFSEGVPHIIKIGATCAVFAGQFNEEDLSTSVHHMEILDQPNLSPGFGRKYVCPLPMFFGGDHGEEKGS